MCAVCKLHGDKLIKEIKIYESMLKKTKSTVTSKKTARSKFSTSTKLV